MEETKTETIKILAVFTVTWRLYKTASMEKKRRLLNLWGLTLIVTRAVAWETKQPRPQGETDYILRRHRNVVWEPKWRLRNERRNFILMTCHYPDVDLESASDWLKQISRNQSEVTPRSDTSPVLNFCALFSDIIWRGNHCFLRLLARFTNKATFLALSLCTSLSYLSMKLFDGFFSTLSVWKLNKGTTLKQKNRLTRNVIFLSLVGTLIVGATEDLKL